RSILVALFTTRIIPQRLLVFLTCHPLSGSSPVSQPYQSRLIIRRHGDELRASWLADAGREALSFPLTLPLDKDAAADLRWYLETFIQFPGYGDRARAAGIESRMKEWGDRAYQALFRNPAGADA